MKSRQRLFCLLFCTFCTAQAQSYLEEVFEAVTPRILRESPLFSDSSKFTSENYYYHLVHNTKKHRTEDTTSSTQIYTISSKSEVTLARKNWGFAGTVNFHTFHTSIASIQDLDTTCLSMNTPITTGEVSGWIKSNNGMAMGATIGSSFFPHYTSETTAKSLGANLPCTFRFRVEYTGERVHTGGEFYQGVVTATVPKYELQPSGNYQTFPTSTMEHNFKFDIGMHSDKGAFTVAISAHRLWGTKFTTGGNALPMMPGLHSYILELDGVIGKFSSLIKLWSGRGFIYGHDSDEYSDRFLKCDNVDYLRLFSNILYRGNTLSGGFFAELFKGDMPDYGYIDFYPFSSWAIFNPKAYRISEALFDYTNIGGEINYTKTWTGVTQSLFGLKCSYMNMHMEALRETKQIAVLIPIYVDDTTITYIDQQLILGDIIIEQSFLIKKVLLTFGVKQLIPIMLSNNSDNSTPSTESSYEKSLYGGLRIHLNLSVPLRQASTTPSD